MLDTITRSTLVQELVPFVAKVGEDEGMSAECEPDLE